MKFENIKDYVFSHLIFPKILIIDKPGIIFSKTIRKFSRSYVKTRVVYYFDDLFVKLYLDSVDKIGKVKTDELWYKIGKDGASRYILFSGSRKIPSVFVNVAMEHVFDTLNSTGMTFAKKIYFDLENEFLITEGSHCVNCRKTQSGAMVAGLTSGILSSFFAKNIEAEAFCEKCPLGCCIVASGKMEKKYIPDYPRLGPINDYNKMNFFSEFFNCSNQVSFSDMLKFKKVKVDPLLNVFLFRGNTIVPSEIGLVDLIYDNYKIAGYENLFRDSLVRSSEHLAFNLFEKDSSSSEKLKAFNSMLASFGWGIPHVSFCEKNVIFQLRTPPFSRYGPGYISSFLNGALNYFFDSKFKLKKIKKSFNPYKLYFYFEA